MSAELAISLAKTSKNQGALQTSAIAASRGNNMQKVNNHEP